MNPDSRTEENTHWMMANQASAFNDCCNIYAPRYREATIFRYLGASPDNVRRTMDLAYSDVERAFDYYLQHYNQGKPFILASHSQGTEHAFRLLQERIDQRAPAGRMVAAYLIGSRALDNELAAELQATPVCDDPAGTGCLIHWATYGPAGSTAAPPGSQLVCVNPLSWRQDGAGTTADSHLGAVPPSGAFSVKLWGDDSPQDITFEPLAAPRPALTGAQCRDGQLVVEDLSDSPFGDLIIRAGDNYHGLDYPLFYMDIRANAARRIEAFTSTLSH